LNRAVTLIEEKRARGPRKSRFGAAPGRALGDHPDKGGPVMVKSGRYGPYVSHDGINATLASDMTPETVTLEQAVGLLDARAARGVGKASNKRPSKPRTTARKAKSKPTPSVHPKAAARDEKKRARKAKAR
jgi:DNA topoisomerase I